MLEKTLNRFVSAFAKGMELADAEKPTAKNFFPGIGPHEEDKTVKMVLRQIASLELMGGAFEFDLQVSYPGGSKKRCDLQFQHGGTPFYVEVKMMRKLRNNGNSEDSATGHILSPYDDDRSALTDIDKLRNSGFQGPKAILIYGYDYDAFPLEKVIRAFEQLADAKLGKRFSASFAGLVHPHHQRGEVYGWLVRE